MPNKRVFGAIIHCECNRKAHEVAPCVVIDFDADGKSVGIDIDRAKDIIDLVKLETESIPIKDSVA